LVLGADLSKQHVTVCLTAISSRAPTLHLALESLVRQKYGNFSVHVYVSREPYLLDQGDFVISPQCREILRKYPNVFFFYVPNLGPYRKVLPFLQAHFGENRLFATADDDTVYPDNWLSTLVHHYAVRRCTVAFRGHQMLPADDRWQNYRRWMTTGVKDRQSMFGLPTGKDGVLYNAMFFHRNVLDVETAMSLAPTVDDLWLKWHTAFAGVPVFLINSDYKTQSFVDVGAGESLYQSYNKQGGNDAAIQRLEAHSRQAFGETLLERLSSHAANPVVHPAEVAVLP
jgi:hypothetical protein